MSQFRYLIGGMMAASLALLTACRSRVIDVTIANQGPGLNVVEFDYPNASFGVNALATGGRYQYRIQVKGAGPVTLQFEDAAGHKSTVTGPKVNPGDQGALTVQIESTGAVTWRPSLTQSQ